MLRIWPFSPVLLGLLILVCTSLHGILLPLRLPWSHRGHRHRGYCQEVKNCILSMKQFWIATSVFVRVLDFHRYFLLLVSSRRPTHVSTLVHSPFIPWRCEGSRLNSEPDEDNERETLSISSRPLGTRFQRHWTPRVLLLDRFRLKLSSYYFWFIQNTERYVLRKMYFSPSFKILQEDQMNPVNYLTFYHLNTSW